MLLKIQQNIEVTKTKALLVSIQHNKKMNIQFFYSILQNLKKLIFLKKKNLKRRTLQGIFVIYDYKGMFIPFWNNIDTETGAC